MSSVHHHHQMPGLDLPCLAFHDLDRSTTLLRVSDHNRVVAGDTADELLRNKIICPTAQGLLLVRDPGTMATFLWSPTNGDKFQLPPLDEGLVDDTVLMDGHCLISDKPSAPGCVVLLVEASANTFMWYCRPGDDAWAKYDYDIGSQVLRYGPDEEDQYEKIAICPIAACRGRFYFSCRATELRVTDFPGADPALGAIAIDDTVAADGSYGYGHEASHGLIFLVESGGELYMVRLLFASPEDAGWEDEIDRLSVHTMDFAARRWRNVSDLGGRAFLLSRFYFGASAGSGGERGLQPDCVYFLFSRTNCLQVFDVKEGTHQLHKLDQAPDADKAFWLLSADP